MKDLIHILISWDFRRKNLCIFFLPIEFSTSRETRQYSNVIVSAYRIINNISSHFTGYITMELRYIHFSDFLEGPPTNNPNTRGKISIRIYSRERIENSMKLMSFDRDKDSFYFWFFARNWLTATCYI